MVSDVRQKQWVRYRGGGRPAGRSRGPLQGLPGLQGGGGRHGPRAAASGCRPSRCRMARPAVCRAARRWRGGQSLGSVRPTDYLQLRYR